MDLSNKISSCFNDSFANIDTLRVAICKPSNNKSQLHAGIIFLASDGQVKLLHQPYHFQPLLGDPDHRYVWFDIPIAEENKLHMAMICELVADANRGGIPYSICHDGATLNDSGEYISNNPYTGLTCATFVLELFHSQGIYIIDFDKWKHVQPDKRWQLQILQGLARSGLASQEHIAYQLKRLNEGAIRYTPSLVTSAAITEGAPHGYEPLKSIAKAIEEQVSAHRQAIAKHFSR